MLRPSLIACPECACHVRANSTSCPHCDAPLAPQAPGESRSIRRAAVAVSLGLAVSVAQLAACDDGTGAGGAGGATTSSTTGSDTSSIATYGVGSTVGSTSTSSGSSTTGSSTGTGN